MHGPNNKPQTFQGNLANLPPALQPLQAIPNWVMWKWQFQNNKWTKVPYRSNGGKASTTNPESWSSYETCIAALSGNGFDGIGFNLLKSGVVAFDVDKCRDPETGELKVQAKKLLQRCGNTYAEVTVSGTGIRIIGLGDSEVNRQKKYDVGDGVSVEVYRCTETARYITVSGSALPGYEGSLVNIDDVIDEVYEECEAHRGGGSDISSDGLVEDGELTGKLVKLLEMEDLGSSNKHGKYNSQSELLFGFLTGCARAQVAKQVAHDACLDVAYAGKAIHQHCLGNGGSSYVVRQIAKAWQTVEKERAAVDDRIAQINSNHALVLAGNKAAIMKFESETKFKLLQVSAFKQWFANQLIRVGKRVTSVGEYWLAHPQRRQYEGIEFDPGAGGRPEYYNLWQGFAVGSMQGDCSKFLAHVKNNAAKGDEATFLWIMGWWAQIFQQPAVKMGTSLVLRGDFGTGKSKMGEVMETLLGDHFMTVSAARYITGQFNSHMASLLVLHADEAFWAGDKQSVGSLRSLVTSPHYPIEFKGIDPIYIKNYVRLFTTGNPDWMIPAGFKERRWAVFDMGQAHLQDHRYFEAIDHEMENRGREALLHYLLNFDLSQVDLRSIPKTAALLDQQIESMSPEQAWWFDTLMSGQLPAQLLGEEPRICTKQSIYRRYIRHAQLSGVNHRSIETKIATFLRKQLEPVLVTNKPRIAGEQVPCFRFPPLGECRKLFAEKLGQTLDWGEGWQLEEWQQHINEDEEWQQRWEREHPGQEFPF